MKCQQITINSNLVDRSIFLPGFVYLLMPSVYRVWNEIQFRCIRILDQDFHFSLNCIILTVWKWQLFTGMIIVCFIFQDCFFRFGFGFGFRVKKTLEQLSRIRYLTECKIPTLFCGIFKSRKKSCSWKLFYFPLRLKLFLGLLGSMYWWFDSFIQTSDRHFHIKIMYVFFKYLQGPIYGLIICGQKLMLRIFFSNLMNMMVYICQN